jgi:hypothetical protein
MPVIDSPVPPRKTGAHVVALKALRQVRDDGLRDRVAAFLVKRVRHDGVDADPPVMVAGVFVVHAHHLGTVAKDAERALRRLRREVAAQDGQQYLLEKLPADIDNRGCHVLLFVR